ncbi:MAG: sensor histidine kinase [Candidatus Marinimicrobia bacterium]|nr:sensor histidine kinase [Candidatus Neomarinimicrobiota bacterium]
MEAPGFFLFISTTITLITAMAITLYVRYSVRQAVHARMEEESLRLEKHKIEDKLIIARQMATIGALAGGLTYHLNTTLYGVNELAKILRSTAENNHTVMNLSQMISDQLSDAISVSNRVCQATYPDRMQLSHVSASEIVKNVTKSLYNPNGVELEITTACQDDIIFANSQLVQQVVENVLTNALNALAGPGSTVHISFSNPESNKKISGGSLIPSYSPHLQMEITDNGTGIVPETLDNVFLPHFSNDGPSSHIKSGLGLPLCYAIMQMLQGDIAISSRRGKGTSVSLTFPLALDREDTKSMGIDHPITPIDEILLHLNNSSLMGNA